MTTLTPELYAKLLVRLLRRRGVAMDELLAELGLSPEELREQEPRLCVQLAEALPRHRGTVAMAFATAFANELQQLGLLSAGVAPQPPAARVEPEKLLPSFMQPSAPPVAPAPPPPKPPSALAATMDPDMARCAGVGVAAAAAGLRRRRTRA